MTAAREITGPHGLHCYRKLGKRPDYTSQGYKDQSVPRSKFFISKSLLLVQSDLMIEDYRKTGFDISMRYGTRENRYRVPFFRLVARRISRVHEPMKNVFGGTSLNLRALLPLKSRSLRRTIPLKIASAPVKILVEMSKVQTSSKARWRYPKLRSRRTRGNGFHSRPIFLPRLSVPFSSPPPLARLQTSWSDSGLDQKILACLTEGNRGTRAFLLFFRSFYDLLFGKSTLRVKIGKLRKVEEDERFSFYSGKFAFVINNICMKFFKISLEFSSYGWEGNIRGLFYLV